MPERERRERKPAREVDTAFGRRGFEWIKTDYFCRDCGQQDVWQSAVDGSDYYHDCSASCHSCGAEMCCVPKLSDGL
jgi:transcription elongation factor Elf1